MADDIDLKVEIPETPELPTVEEGKQDTTDWKAKAQELQGQLKESRGIAKRYQTKLGKVSDGSKPAAQPDNSKANSQPEKKGFDYGQLAYLESKGVSNAEDQGYLESIVKDSGVELKDLLGKAWVQAELKERAQLRATADATPSNTKRAGNQTRNDVDYWIAKGELPPADQPNLRQAVVNAKIAAAKNANQFTSQNVVQS